MGNCIYAAEKEAFPVFEGPEPRWHAELREKWESLDESPDGLGSVRLTELVPHQHVEAHMRTQLIMGKGTMLVSLRLDSEDPDDEADAELFLGNVLAHSIKVRPYFYQAVLHGCHPVPYLHHHMVELRCSRNFKVIGLIAHDMQQNNGSFYDYERECFHVLPRGSYEGWFHITWINLRLIYGILKASLKC